MMTSTRKSGSCVLIVDDDRYMRETIGMILDADGYSMAFAVSGREALARSRELLPDLVLLDVMMEEMDGFETCRRLRADPLLAEVPVIFITALGDDDSRLSGLGLGADDYLPKPFSAAELRAKVSNILKLDRYRKLMAERGKFAWVVEEADTGYLLLSEDGSMEYANRVARGYLNLPPPEPGQAIGGHFLTWAARQHYRCEPLSAWRDWPESHDPELPRYLVRPATTQADALWLQLRAFLPPAKIAQGLLLALHDISPQVSQRQQTWSFHALISHKLNTPLNSLNVLDFLVPHLHGQIARKDWELLQLAWEGSQSLRQHLNRILQYTQAGQHSAPGFTLAELPELVAELGRDMGIVISLILPERLRQARLNLGFTDIRGIFHELLTNARKFHFRQQPEVLLSVSQPASAKLMLCLSDNGQHLPAEVLERVWIPYFQHDKYFTGEIPGLGLGLPMVASVVWSAGGECRLRNRADHPGIVVELELPLMENRGA